MMALHQSYSPATHTDLEVIPYLMQKIEAGEIRVPAFQRDFTWTRSRICELCRSIYAGYPIGSLLILRTSNKSLKAKPDVIPFPPSKVTYPTYFIIDGMQRLSTLYGTLIYNCERVAGSDFDVVYDLKQEEFFHARKKDLEPWVVSLASLFCYDEFVRIQHILLEEFDNVILGRYLYLYNIFQQYKIPMTIIEDRSPAEVADIFIKINRQGQRLSQADFEVAFEWISEHEK